MGRATAAVPVAAGPATPDEADRLALEDDLTCPDTVEQGLATFSAYAGDLLESSSGAPGGTEVRWGERTAEGSGGGGSVAARSVLTGLRGGLVVEGAYGPEAGRATGRDGGKPWAGMAGVIRRYQQVIGGTSG